MSICDLRLNTGKGRTTEIRKSKSKSFYRRVPPGERDLTSSDGDPGTNGVISKTRCGAWNKEQIRSFASRHWWAVSNQQFLLTPAFRQVLRDDATVSRFNGFRTNYQSRWLPHWPEGAVLIKTVRSR
jgi:hypothetical protein